MLENIPAPIPEIDDITETDELDALLDKTAVLVPLNREERQIVRDIVKASDKQELEKQFDLFNINQTKINAVRVIKLNNLLGKIEDQVIRRVEKTPDYISNKELLEYMQVVANQIDRSQKYIETLKDKPMIKVNSQKNEVNINIGTELNRDSKEKVIDAIQGILKQLNAEADNVVEVEVESQNPTEFNNVVIEPEDDTVEDVESVNFNPLYAEGDEE